MTTALYVLIAALGFAFVIFIHELGHFLFAKWAGVRVLRFSIGFGPVLLRRQHGETEYALSLLPLGGYVQMAGEEPVDSKAGDARPEPGTFQAASAWWRMWILLGGVLFNLISSWIILFGLALWGMPLMSNRVAAITPTVVDHTHARVPSPAHELGLRIGDRIVAINGDAVRSFDDVLFHGAFAGGSPVEVEVERDGQRLRLPATGAAPVRMVYDPTAGRSVFGVQFPTSTLLLGAVRPDGRLATAGDLLRPGDRLVAIDRRPLPTDAGGTVDFTGQEAEMALKRLSWRGGTVALGVRRAGQTVEVEVALARDHLAVLGLPPLIGQVERHGPADRAGLRPGDWIVAVDGRPPASNDAFVGAVDQVGVERALALDVVRDGQRLRLSASPAMLTGRPRLGLVFAEPSGWLPDGVLPGAPGRFLVDVGLRRDPERESGVVTVRTATSGRIRLVPLPESLRDQAWLGRERHPSLIRHLLGARATPAPLATLASGMIADDLLAGVPRGPFAVRVAGDDGAPGVVDFAEMGAAGPAFHAALRLSAGERVLGLRPSASGPMLAIATGLEGLASATVAYAPGGWAVGFAPEELPYRLRSSGEAFVIVWDSSKNMIVKSLLLIPRFFADEAAGGIDPNKTLSGPVGMFRALKQKAEYTGFDGFLRIVALIGLNLVLVNLLPIPVTDGGQLVFLGLEVLRGKPVPVGVRTIAAVLGTALVLALMAYVVGLDLLRLVGFL